MLFRAISIVLLFLAPFAQAQERTLALVGATIFPTPNPEPIRDGVVLIEGGRIAAVGPRASVKIPAARPVLRNCGLGARNKETRAGGGLRLDERGGHGLRAVLAALTNAPAKRFGRGQDLGAVAPGFSADLVVLKEDPSADPSKLAGATLHFATAR
ncbi:MAG: amidohydrolase family protein [Rhodospirillaceae bacterium]